MTLALLSCQETSPGLEFLSTLAELSSWTSDSFPCECGASNGAECLVGDWAVFTVSGEAEVRSCLQSVTR